MPIFVKGSEKAKSCKNPHTHTHTHTHIHTHTRTHIHNLSRIKLEPKELEI